MIKVRRGGEKTKANHIPKDINVQLILFFFFKWDKEGYEKICIWLRKVTAISFPISFFPKQFSLMLQFKHLTSGSCDTLPNGKAKKSACVLILKALADPRDPY